jgi:chromosome segregation and condensation protein ScpB
MRRRYSEKITFLCYFFALIYALHLSAADSLTTAETHQIQLNAYVEQSKIPLNGTAILHIELSWPGKLSQYQIEPVSQPILTNFLLEGSGSENRLLTLEDGSLKAIKAVTYRLRPLEMGMAYIDGIIIKYINRESGDEESLSSQRIMIEILEPIPEGDGYRFQAVVYIILLGIFFGITAYFIFLYIRKKKLSQEVGTPQVSLAESYLNRLTKEVDPRGTNLEEMISRLSRIFREYLEQDFNIPARELSNQELIEKLKLKDIEDHDIKNLIQVFEKFDLIKFSGKSIDPNEFTHIYGTIENFLLKRKQQSDTVEASEKEES